MTQAQAVLKHLQEKGSITSIEAISLYGATRLSSIIYNLRKAGYNISIERKRFKNRFNNESCIGIYRLEGINDERGIRENRL